MNRAFLTRLGLDLLAAALLVFCLSYWWLGNLTHEIAGTVLFLLLIVHNGFNRRWYGRLREGGDARSVFARTATIVLLLSMLVPLVTSILISNALSPLLSAFGGFTVRQIHILAGYWALVLVAIHLGLRWPMLMGVARWTFGITRPSAVRTALLRAAAAIIAAYGLWSSSVLALGTKLSMQMTLDWWNFEESVLGFFIHCAAVMGLYIALTHCGLHLLRRMRRSHA
jgi:hypothetical protein